MVLSSTRKVEGAAKKFPFGAARAQSDTFGTLIVRLGGVLPETSRIM